MAKSLGTAETAKKFEDLVAKFLETTDEGAKIGGI